MNARWACTSLMTGEILIDDKLVTFRGPGDAMARGHCMVHQHFMFDSVFTVAENVGARPRADPPPGFLDHRKARRLVAEVFRR